MDKIIVVDGKTRVGKSTFAKKMHDEMIARARFYRALRWIVYILSIVIAGAIIGKWFA